MASPRNVAPRLRHMALTRSSTQNQATFFVDSLSKPTPRPGKRYPWQKESTSSYSADGLPAELPAAPQCKLKKVHKWIGRIWHQLQ